MKITITFVFFALIAQTFSLTCPTFACTQNFTNNQTCASKTIVGNVFSVLIKPCADSKLACPFTENLDEDDLCAAPVLKMYPGEFCNTAADCIQGTCTGNICQSGAAGATCKTHLDCGAGLFCLSGNCTALIGVGGACSDTTLCQVGLICAAGNCTKIASIENNQPAVVPATCKSYYMENGNCTDGPMLNDTERKMPACTPDGVCHYTFKGTAGKIATEPCTCGLTNYTTGVCRPGEGDAKLDDVRRKYLSFRLPVI